ncbi:MAG: DNA-processing protein DprA [Syntrophales bacterium]|nr:DNA-processing protein DprA [Syntrophales bacterium]
MDIMRLHLDNSNYPSQVKHYLGEQAPASINVLGNIDILHHNKLALFCSVKCPGNLILQTYDLAQSLREAGIKVISGFHSPMERECLMILLRGTQSVIVCPARGIRGMRLKKDLKYLVANGQVLFLSPFTEEQRRITTETAIMRNRFVSAIADSIFVAYAAPGSKMEQLCKEILVWRKPLYMLENVANDKLISIGAVPVTPDSITIKMVIS